jgi:hypothetical protein
MNKNWILLAVMGLAIFGGGAIVDFMAGFGWLGVVTAPLVAIPLCGLLWHYAD